MSSIRREIREDRRIGSSVPADLIESDPRLTLLSDELHSEGVAPEVPLRNMDCYSSMAYFHNHPTRVAECFDHPYREEID